MLKPEMVPPDGGWGWVIVFAMALNNVIFIPIMQNFGLIFADAFSQMGFTATDGSVIITMNAAVSMMSGLFNGPLLRSFGYRKVSVLSAIFSLLGIILTAYSTSFTTLVISYGLITSIGMGMGMSSYPLAFNSYFRKLRNKAMGISMTITGIGPVVMPQLISLLMYVYGVQGAMLVLAGVSAHSFVSAMLLQPVKWHMVPKVVDVEEAKNEDKDETNPELEDTLIKKGLEDDVNSNIIKRTDSNLSINYDSEVRAIYGFDTPLTGSVLDLHSGMRPRRSSVTSSYRSILEKPAKSKWASIHSMGGSNFGSVVDIAESGKNHMNGILIPAIPGADEIVYNDLSIKKKEKRESKIKTFLMKVVHFFDLTLLKDPIYVNIMLGMSFAIFAELNFSLLTPFILADLKLEISQIAMFLSVLSIADILFRFLAPFIGDYLNQPPRIMYTFSLVLLVITRFLLLVFSTYTSLLGVALCLGIAKGVRTVYMSLVIPSYVPIERLASASGLQMLVNGVCVLIGGPMLGLIRDATGSYASCITIMNCVTCLTVIMWITEAVYLKWRKSKSKEQELEGL